MQCTNCGAQLADDATVCASCGAQVASAPQPTGAPVPFEAFELAPVPQGVRVNSLEPIDTPKGKRSAMYVSCSIPVEQAYEAASQILADNGYKPKPYDGQMVWKKGTGLATAMHYVNVVPVQGHLYVQGWVMMGVGDATIMEQPLHGIVAAIPKSSTKKVVMKIKDACRA